MKSIPWLLMVALAAVGCGGSSGDDTTGDDTTGDDSTGDDSTGDDSTGDDAPASVDAAGGVAIHMTFSVSAGVHSSPNLHDPLSGPIYGQLFHTSDVTLTGPVDGAQEFAAIEVAAVDLTTAATAGSFTTPGLPAGDYTFLGFFDVDGNGSADRSPDSGDPVTIPITNPVTVSASGATVELTVVFDYVY